jgi:hypothetical protein
MAEGYGQNRNRAKELLSFSHFRREVIDMKKAGIYSRIFLLISATGLVFLMLILLLYFIKNKQEDIILESSRAQFRNEAHAIITLKTGGTKQVVNDYTFWTDFTIKLYQHDTAWYNNNITPILKSFHLDFVCVYDSMFNLVHEASSDGIESGDFIARKALEKIKEQRFLNYFQIIPEGLIEISAASIHPDFDPSHTITAPSGYMIVAKRWNKDFLQELSSLSGASLAVKNLDDITVIHVPYTITTSMELPGWTGENVARITFTRTLESFKLYNKMSVLMITFLMCFFLVTIFSFHKELHFSLVCPYEN